MKHLRKSIDEIDSSILHSLVARMSVVKKIAKEKSGNGNSVRDRIREEEILSRLSDLAEQSALNPELIRGVFTIIFEHSVAIQKKIIGGKFIQQGEKEK